VTFPDERSLADDVATPAAAQLEPSLTDTTSTIVDSSPDVTVEDFDFEAFLTGARPTRRAAKLYARADLVGTLEERMQELEAEGIDPADDDTFCRLYQEFHDSGRWFHVEKRSSEWERDFRAKTAERLGIKLDEQGKVTSEADGLALAFEQTAAQTVIPSNLSAAGVRRMYEVNQGEVNKLFLAVRQVNEAMAETVRVVGPDFSPRRSTSPAT
jgi:hypothetical protein